MEIDNHQSQPLSLLRAVAKPNQLDPSNRADRSDPAARARAAELTAKIRANPAATIGNTKPISLAAVDPESLSIGTTNGSESNGALTVDGLLEEWGDKGSRYDFDLDGTVNMNDLLALLAKLSGAQGPPPADEAKIDPPLGTVAPNHGETGNIAPPQDDTPPAALTVEGLMEEWGEKGSNYDLDGDGLVNMADLLQLLASLSGQTEATSDPKTRPDVNLAAAEPVAPPLGDVAPADAPEPMSIAGLLEAWGQKDSSYDLDGDGQVNMGDLLALLSSLTPANGRTPAEDPVLTVTADGTNPGTRSGPVTIDQARDESIITPAPPNLDPPTIGAEANAVEESEPAQMTVKGLMNDWGQRGSMYDLDTNGVVNMNDLLALLSQLSPAGAETGNEAAVAASDLVSQPGREAAARHKIGRLADSLFSRLEKSGFADRPPTNIHGVVSSLQLPTEEHKELIDRLATRYRDGLGVNFRG